MPSSSALSEVFTKPNLRRAWRWISVAGDQLYRDLCGPAYAEFSVHSEAFLEDISDRLRRGLYEFSAARKVYLPKSNRTSRTYTVLPTHDQIVYQAFVNVVADHFDPFAKPGYFNVSFGNLYAGRTSRTFYRDWRTCRRIYIARARQA